MARKTAEARNALPPTAGRDNRRTTQIMKPTEPPHAVTNARFALLHGLPVGPVLPPTTPVPLRKSVRSSRVGIRRNTASAAGFRLRLGGGRCAPAAIHYALLCACAPLPRSPTADRSREVRNGSSVVEIANQRLTILGFLNQ